MKASTHKEIVLTWEQFENQFKPLQNQITDREEFNGWLFETYDKDERYIRVYAQKHPAHVWTIIDCGGISITSGWHYVNRFGYIITELPCPENIKIDVIDDEDMYEEWN